MANKSIFDAFERMWQHVVARFGDYATSESFNSHVDNKSNPHEVTKEQVGLGNVDNTADAAKVVLSATKATQDANGNNIAATYETKSDAESKLAESKAYSDAAAAAVKNDLLNGAGEAYDTLIELGELIDENHDAINALEIVATSKADKSDIVQSDWELNDETALDYVKNRTHYDSRTSELLNLTFNGDYENYEHVLIVDTGNTQMYVAKITDSVVSHEDLSNCNIVFAELNEGNKYDYTNYNGSEYFSLNGNNSFPKRTMDFIVRDDEVEVAPNVVLSKGIWFAVNIGQNEIISYTQSFTSDTVMLEQGELKQLDEKYIPNTIARDLDLEVINYNLTNLISHNSEQILRIDETLENLNLNDTIFDWINLRDISTGFTYMVQIKDGIIVTSSKVTGISMTTQPNKTTYMVGESIDLTGMVIEATCEDGSVKNVANDVTYSPEIAIEGTTSIEVKYYNSGNEYIITVPITIISIEDLLVDFEYTDNNDGTYTLTGWKQTLNGEPSTEMVIPDNSSIKL